MFILTKKLNRKQVLIGAEGYLCADPVRRDILLELRSHLFGIGAMFLTAWDINALTRALGETPECVCDYTEIEKLCQELESAWNAQLHYRKAELVQLMSGEIKDVKLEFLIAQVREKLIKEFPEATA